MTDENIENAVKEEDITNEDLKKEIKVDSELKNMLVNYVGMQHNPENNEITVEMIVGTMAKEFPEFLMAVAEENFIRGYKQAFADIEQHQKQLAETEVVEEGKEEVKEETNEENSD